MLIDIVVPDGNEEEFITMAQKLGYEGLCFAYPGKPKKKEYSFPIFFASILEGDKRGSGITLLHNPPGIREAIEKSPPSIIYGMEKQDKDFLHQRNSGLNHIVCRIAAQKGVAFAFSFQEIIKKDPVMIGRIMQNIVLCQKYKNACVIASFASTPYRMRSPYDLRSLFIELDMHPKKAKDSLHEMERVIFPEKKISLVEE